MRLAAAATGVEAVDQAARQIGTCLLNATMPLGGRAGAGLRLANRTPTSIKGCGSVGPIWLDRLSNEENDRCAAAIRQYRNIAHPDSVLLVMRRTLRAAPSTLRCELEIAPLPDRAQGAVALFNQLNRDLDLFAHAVTPRNDRERYEARRSRDTAVAPRGSGPIGILLASLGVRHDNRQASEQIESRHAIVGLGTPSRLRAEDERTAAGWTAVNPVVFGWLLAPRRTSDPDVPSVEQVRLQALISVPSWWRIAVIDQVTCWVSAADVADRLDGVRGRAASSMPDLWDAVYSGLYPTCRHEPTTVRLPGSVADISAVLGIGGVQKPTVVGLRSGERFDAPQHRLHACQPARLLIEGRGLWRNTDVTLGSQRADRVRITPDMRGIIAEFDRVEWPSLSRRLTEVERLGFGLDQDKLDKGHAVIAPLKVWTSEGAIEVPGGVLVLRPEKAESNGAVNACAPDRMPDWRRADPSKPDSSQQGRTPETQAATATR